MSIEPQTQKISNQPQSQIQPLIFDETLLSKKRQEEIKKLEQDAIALNAMFQDLQLLVDNQQSEIDLIEENVSDSKQHVEQAEVQLIKAKKNQSKAFKRTMAIGAFAGAVILAAPAALLHAGPPLVAKLLVGGAAAGAAGGAAASL